MYYEYIMRGCEIDVGYFIERYYYIYIFYILDNALLITLPKV